MIRLTSVIFVLRFSVNPSFGPRTIFSLSVVETLRFSNPRVSGIIASDAPCTKRAALPSVIAVITRLRSLSVPISLTCRILLIMPSLLVSASCFAVINGRIMKSAIVSSLAIPFIYTINADVFPAILSWRKITSVFISARNTFRSSASAAFISAGTGRNSGSPCGAISFQPPKLFGSPASRSVSSYRISCLSKAKKRSNLPRMPSPPRSLS